jgi:tetratricopeptide (TPR) repeat protein
MRLRREKRSYSVAVVAGVLFLAMAPFGVLAAAADTDAHEAKAHFERGMAHFNLQEYEQAAREFEDAYRLKPDPAILFNLAQAHRLAGHDERALHLYRAYLRTVPDAPNRADVEARVAALEDAVARRKATSPAPQPAQAAAQPTAPTKAVVATPTRTAPTNKPLYKRWWLWTAVGVVAVGVGTGLVLGLVPANAPVPANTDGHVAVRF